MISIGKSKADRRIAKRAKQLFGDEEQLLPDKVRSAVDSVARRGGSLGRQLYVETQKRKGAGKEYLKQRGKKLLSGSKKAVGTEARSLLVDPAKRGRRRKR